MQTVTEPALEPAGSFRVSSGVQCQAPAILDAAIATMAHLRVYALPFCL
jgi:hypothetical protein